MGFDVVTRCEMTPWFSCPGKTHQERYALDGSQRRVAVSRTVNFGIPGKQIESLHVQEMQQVDENPILG